MPKTLGRWSLARTEHLAQHRFKTHSVYFFPSAARFSSAREPLSMFAIE
jgi:hypothetical protein